MNFPFIGVVVRRREDKDGHAASFRAETVNERDWEFLASQYPPDPIRRSDFSRVGKPWAQPFIQRAFTFNIASTQAIMEEGFLYGKVPGVLVTAQPGGGQLPVGERSNISRPLVGTFGDRSTVQAPGGYVTGARNPVYSPGGFVYDFGR